MPNHVTTRCTITGPKNDIATFRSRMIVQQPADESGHREAHDILDFDRIIPMTHTDSIIESIAKWGTKWNSYSLTLVSEKPLQFIFNTAWSFPEPVFRALATEYPNLKFDCVTFDEGSNFAGKGVFHGADPSATWALGDATDDLYLEVYGYERER